MDRNAGIAKPNPRATILLLGTIVLLGAFLRIYGLTHQSLWLDEVIGIDIARKSCGEIIPALKSDVSPPLHYFLLHFWIKAFGSGEAAVRALPCLFGILFVPAVFFVGASLFNRKTGLMSALIAALGEFHVRYSQEVRMYSMLILLGLLSLYFLSKALAEDRPKYWIGYVLFTVLTIYTHNYGLFIAASGVAYVLIQRAARGRSLKRWAVSLGLIGLLYLPWLPILYQNLSSPSFVGWIPRFRPFHVLETFRAFSGFVFHVFPPAVNNSLVLAGLMIFLACLGAAALALIKDFRTGTTRTGRPSPLMLMFCYLVVTLAIPMAISIVKPIFLAERYSIAAWPAFVLLAGFGASKVKGRWAAAAGLAFFVFLSSVSLYWYNHGWIKSRDRDAAAFLDAYATPDDLLVFFPKDISIPVDYYVHSSFERLSYAQGRAPEDLAAEAAKRLKNDRSRVFLISQPEAKWYPGIDRLQDAFKQRFRRGMKRWFREKLITIYVPKRQSGPALPNQGKPQFSPVAERSAGRRK